MNDLIFWLSVFVILVTWPYAMAAPFLYWGSVKAARRQKEIWDAQVRKQFEAYGRERA